MSAAKVIGRYEILEELGHGAMGCVYKAKDPAVGRTVALKTILGAALEGAQGDEYRARFYREARAAGSLAHPGIVPVFDVGEYEGTPFLVMEYVEGRTLAAAMRGGERFTLERACEIGQQLAEALAHAHRKGVIHRDVKPANILMAPPEGSGRERPRITDFGVAKLAGNDVTTTGQMLGTPAFMPPEQFTGAPLDGRADLFSVGVILYALVTGEQPFHGETVTAVSYTVVHTDPVAPRKFNPGIPARLEAAILKCLAKSPADRFQTGEELAQELAALRGVAEPDAAMRTIPTAGGAAEADATLDPSAGRMPTKPIPMPVADSEATLEPGATERSITQSLKPYVVPELASSGIMQAPGAGKKRKIPIGTVAVAAVVLATVALLVVGWVMARNRNRAAQQAAAAAAQSAAGSNTAGQPSPAGAPAAAPQTDQSAAPAAATAAPVSGTAAATKTPAPRARAAAPAVDPRTLDPKISAKLKIELSHFPAGMPFTVEMNRKAYLNAVAGDKSTFENVLVPPGVQAFQVVLKAGGQRKVSNIVSYEFKAKKRKTLKIDLEGAGAAGTPGRDAKVVVELK
jgi:serine/threonine-protein kinase